MGLNVCPAAVATAPIDVVWALLVNPDQYGWMDGRVVRIVPEGKSRTGPTASLRISWLTVTLTVLEVDEDARRMA